MKSSGEIMEILEAYDLVGTYRGAARLAGCDHHTVRHYVERPATPLWPEAEDCTPPNALARRILPYLPTNDR